MSATWYAVGCWAPLILWALVERSARRNAEGDRHHLRDARDRFKAEAREAQERAEEWCEKYETLAAEQNDTKRRAIRAERTARALENFALSGPLSLATIRATPAAEDHP